MLDAAEGERFEEAAQLRDAMRTVQTLHDRQQKMATAELGHRDVFGLKLGPAGVAIQVFQVRSGRVVERIELGTEEAIVGASEGEVLEAAIQQFYELRGAPPEIHVPAEPERARGARDLAVGARRPAGADRRAAARREARPRRSRQPQRRRSPIRRGSTRRQTAQYDALETLQHVLGAAGAAAADRVLRHLDDPGQRDRGVDGGLRRRPDAARRVSEVRIRGLGGWGWQDSRLSAAADVPSLRATEPRAPSPSSHDDFAAMHEVVLPPLSQAARAGRAVSRSRR